MLFRVIFLRHGFNFDSFVLSSSQPQLITLQELLMYTSRSILRGSFVSCSVLAVAVCPAAWSDSESLLDIVIGARYL